MSYSKNTWNEGDVITAEKLNNLEEGVSQSNSVYEIELTKEEYSSLIQGTYSEASPLEKNISSEEIINLLKCEKISLTLLEDSDTPLTKIILNLIQVFKEKDTFITNAYSCFSSTSTGINCIMCHTDNSSNKLYITSTKFNSN